MIPIRHDTRFIKLKFVNISHPLKIAMSLPTLVGLPYKK